MRPKVLSGIDFDCDQDLLGKTLIPQVGDSRAHACPAVPFSRSEGCDQVNRLGFCSEPSPQGFDPKTNLGPGNQVMARVVEKCQLTS